MTEGLGVSRRFFATPERSPSADPRAVGSQGAKEEAKEKQRAKRAARLQDEKDADRKRGCELERGI